MFVIRHKKIFLLVTAVYIVIALATIAVLKLQLGIDFTGGTELEITYQNARPEQSFIETGLKNTVPTFSVRPTEQNGFSIQTSYITADQKDALLDAFTFAGERPIDEKFNSIGPVVGEELKRKAAIALVLVASFIVLFVAFAFRKVSEPVSSWAYGFITVITLAHDVVVPTAVFAYLSRFAGVEIDILFVTALLAIWGYSVSDTIVVFDRIREHLRIEKEQRGKTPFDQIVGASLSETYARSINTSLTILISLLALYFFGGEVTKNFVLVLIIGVIGGTYSSIFVASPLLVLWNDMRSPKKGKN